jgi:hypothetical protein
MTAVALNRDRTDFQVRAHEAILDDDPAGTRLTGFRKPRALQAAASAAFKAIGIARDS